MEKRIIAIHLPQYYPFPENDEWWGKGFTEWTNVTKAKPRFYKHYQPHLPADLGFYDLRLKECRIEQIKMAKEYGIYGFCYYHYWFNGKLIMEKPIEAMLNDKEEDFPFMLCWANENWHRNWEGNNNITLIEQKYSKEDDIAHFQYLLPYFQDPRYIKINGKPVICIYKTELFPDFETTAITWRKLAKENGFDLYICRFENGKFIGKEFITENIDAAVEFLPNNLKKYNRYHNPLFEFCRIFLKKTMFNRIFSYKGFVNYVMKLNEKVDYKRYPCLFPGWDNSARRVGRPFTCFKNSQPHIFEKWLDYVYMKFIPYSSDENFIFINAWNEWAEGCHLEPDQKFGKKFLEAILHVVRKYNSQ